MQLKISKCLKKWGKVAKTEARQQASWNWKRFLPEMENHFFKVSYIRFFGFQRHLAAAFMFNYILHDSFWFLCICIWHNWWQLQRQLCTLTALCAGWSSASTVCHNSISISSCQMVQVPQKWELLFTTRWCSSCALQNNDGWFIFSIF